ncbi:rRNA maturation RNase YbeY [Marinicauda sp. Alg238-R41]|jgi:probable rRNA maturation factor|uniref:rRNA maturation RNase YbeY n=1 Tax=Marinicauda sp. Alg238-R41 TaxID=2993447 RepID=UPI0022E7EE7E|nr:rRNA maturation RNase YbeY [Marinicauda sp. Alg238-R41]
MSEPLCEFVTDYDAWSEVDNLEAVCERAIQIAASRMTERRPGTAVILFTGDETVEVLNGQYRARPRPTNVLSFPAPEREGYPGDIALAYQTCVAEAGAAGIALRDRAAHLALHGFLHLNGYTHDEDAAAEAMEALETAVLAELGIADPYLIPERQ